MTHPDRLPVEEVAAVLRAGGVVLLPTDTVYGLAAAAWFERGVDRVYALKARPRDRNLPVMVASPDALEGLGLQITEQAARLLASPLVPGGLTLAIGVDPARAPPWLAGREEVAVRIPDDDWLLDVLRTTGPLLVTSANAHGQATPRTLAEAMAQLSGKPDLAVDGGALDGVASTLVNCRAQPPVIERVGAIDAAVVEAYLA